MAMDQLGMANKTPVSWLHEICTRNNITPKYDLLQVEGAVHEPTFQYRLTLNFNGTVHEETGTGRSKKEAKHNTARAMLNSMELAAQSAETGDAQAVAELEDGRLGASDADMGGNPVGILQELCMKMKYPPPTYDVDSEEGLPHERLFAIACRVGDQFVEIGKGKSKKLAKRMAAHLMADHLRSLPLETGNAFIFDDDDDRIIEQIHALEREFYKPGYKFKPSKGPKSSVEKIFQSRKQYQDMTGPIVEQLQSPDFKTDDPIAFVKQLEDEQNFKAMYVEIDEKTTDDRYQCLVQLTLEPPPVLYGEDDTQEGAKRKAAEDIIFYFTRVTKKYGPKPSVKSDVPGATSTAEASTSFAGAAATTESSTGEAKTDGTSAIGEIFIQSGEKAAGLPNGLYVDQDQDIPATVEELQSAKSSATTLEK